MAWCPAHHDWLPNKMGFATLMAFDRLCQAKMFDLRILKRLTNIVDFTSRYTCIIQNINPCRGCFIARNRIDFGIQRIAVFSTDQGWLRNRGW